MSLPQEGRDGSQDRPSDVLAYVRQQRDYGNAACESGLVQRYIHGYDEVLLLLGTTGGGAGTDTVSPGAKRKRL